MKNSDGRRVREGGECAGHSVGPFGFHRPLRIAWSLAWLSTVVTACAGTHASLPLASPGPLGAGAPTGSFAGKITHVVVIVQENRTFDNIFGGATGVTPPYPGANAAFSPSIAPLMAPAAPSQSLPVSNAHNSWECLKQQNFSDAIWKLVGAKQSQCQAAAVADNGALTYYPAANRTIYWQIAQRNVLGDDFFAVTDTGSYPGHQYIVAEQSLAETANGLPLIVADQPAHDVGCFASPSETLETPILGPNGFAESQNLGYAGECYTARTYADLFAAHGITWAHYATDEKPSAVFNGFINQLGWYLKTTDSSSTTNFPLSDPTLLQNVAAGTLPQFAWVTPPCVNASDHPGFGDYGPQWVGTVINAIGANTALWSHTAIFVIWDDWGGFYDHVIPPPTRQDRLGPGLRIPFLLISPYSAGTGLIVHARADYASIMKWTENLYGFPSLNAVDANATSMAPYFTTTTTATPRPFIPLAAAKANPYISSDCAGSPSNIVD